MTRQQIQNGIHAAGVVVGWLLLVEQGIVYTLQLLGIHLPMTWDVRMVAAGAGLVTLSKLIDSANNAYTTGKFDPAPLLAEVQALRGQLTALVGTPPAQPVGATHPAPAAPLPAAPAPPPAPAGP